jgi:cell fate regulator YaaT (PSP1 superfamily)
MGCGSCTNFKVGSEESISSKASCDVNGSNKLQVFDWLANIDLPESETISEYIEVRFKNSRKEIFTNPFKLQLFTGDVVSVDSKPGYDVGVVSLTGRLVKFQLKRKKQYTSETEFRKILRKASQEEINKWQDVQSLEKEAMYKTRELARELGLTMKISDVEYQGDKSKATFYYTAEERVDFRVLIKNMADHFKVRIEMRQIGNRQEAGRLGGIGSCGRELCCSTWLTDFRSVSTSAARYQQLSLNPQKLTGQCGKLKCCLNYELDMYMESVKEMPKTSVVLKSEKEDAVHFKTDIFKKEIWYVARGSDNKAPFKLKSKQVHEIIEMNKNGIKPSSFFELVEVEAVVEPDYNNVVGQDSLTRFDEKKRKRKGKYRSKGNQNRQYRKNHNNKTGKDGGTNNKK